MITYIITIIYDTCCTGWRAKEQQIINKIIIDLEDLAEAELERLIKHIEIKRNNKLNCC